MMRTKEMTMNDEWHGVEWWPEMTEERFWALYAEYCAGAGARPAGRVGAPVEAGEDGMLVFGPGTPESFAEFVAWRKKMLWRYEN